MIKNRLSIILGEQRMRVSELSQLTGISQNALNKIYHNKTKGVDFDTLNSLTEQYLAKRDEFTQALGKVLTKLRKERKKSVRSIAGEIELSKTTLLLAERGKLDPQISTFCRIAEAFYIQPDDLLKMVLKELPKDWSFLD